MCDSKCNSRQATEDHLAAQPERRLRGVALEHHLPPTWEPALPGRKLSGKEEPLWDKWAAGWGQAGHVLQNRQGHYRGQ